MTPLPSGEVVIGSRTFTLGTVYVPRPGAGPGHPFKPRRLLGYAADSLLPSGRVTVVLVPSGRRQIMAGAVWAAWAGDPVDGGLGASGR
jgi:hypothetical protein